MSTLGVVFFTLAGARPPEENLHSVPWADAIRISRLGPDGTVESTEAVKGAASGWTVDWTLHLWGDERVEEDLEGELKTLIGAGVATEPRCYRVPVCSRILGRWVGGSLWGPEPSLRLSRQLELFPLEWWSGERRRVEAGSLAGWIGDYSASELERGLNRINAFSTLWAKALAPEGAVRRAQWTLAVRIFARLVLQERLAAKGWAGFTFSTLAAYTALLGNAKLWEAKEIEPGNRRLQGPGDATGPSGLKPHGTEGRT